MTEEGKKVGSAGALRRLAERDVWGVVAGAGGLVLLSLVVAAAYVTEPQSPRDFVDGLRLAVDDGAYGPNRRVGERLYGRAGRAREVGADSLADHLLRRSVRAYARASQAAPDPQAALAANDGLAEAYLERGWREVRRGRGGRFGLGRDAEALAVAERIAICVAGIAPTRRRSQINAYIVELEDVLDRPIAGRCPE